MGLRATSLVVTLVAILVLTLCAGMVYRQMRERIALLSANENERILNTLLASLRDHENFGSAIESGEELSRRVAGVAVYLSDGTPLYSWGRVPASFGPGDAELTDVDEFVSREPDRTSVSSSRYNSAPIRFVIPDRNSRTQRFVIRSSRMAPPPHGKASPPGDSPAVKEKKKDLFFFSVLTKGEWLYIDIRHSDYWRERTLMDILFPLAEALIIALAFSMRYLALKNADYRERIERQKNLVVLGTAASTLAHEIKNPLLAIRLQTGILAKLYPESGAEELGIINAEIERLSSLTYRINDYLREPKGAPADFAVSDLVRDCAKSLCGRDPVTSDDAGRASVRMDPDRFRSAFGNLVRNALESGGDPALVEVAISREDRFIVVDVLDRGTGIAPGSARNLFEPFFTTKSKGTGIGLAITRRFIEAANGTVELVSRDGGGARARIRLPETGGDA